MGPTVECVQQTGHMILRLGPDEEKMFWLPISMANLACKAAKPAALDVRTVLSAEFQP